MPDGRGSLRIPKLTLPTPPQAIPARSRKPRAARRRGESRASSPAARARTPEGMTLLVELAEAAAGAGARSAADGMNFPTAPSAERRRQRRRRRRRPRARSARFLERRTRRRR